MVKNAAAVFDSSFRRYLTPNTTRGEQFDTRAITAMKPKLCDAEASNELNDP